MFDNIFQQCVSKHANCGFGLIIFQLGTMRWHFFATPTNFFWKISETFKEIFFQKFGWWGRDRKEPIGYRGQWNELINK